VNLFLKLTRLSDISSSEANQNLAIVGGLDFAIWVETQDQGEVLALDLSVDNVAIDASITITNFTIGLEANKFQVGTIDVVTSTIGRVSTLTLKTLINTGFLVLIPVLNTFLEKLHVQFPDNILGIFTLDDLNLAYYDNYIYLGATPTFLPPTVTAF